MNSSMVMARVSLLMAPALSPTAKLIWLVRSIDRHDAPVQPSLLARRSGAGRNTVVRALAELSARGWYAMGQRRSGTGVHPDTATIPMPVALLAKRGLGARAKLLYGQLQLTAGFRYPSGKFTFASLAAQLGCSLPTVRKSVRELEAKEWLTVTQKTERSPVEFSLCSPGDAEAAAARRRIARGGWKGEAIMRECLTLLVESDHFEDNATPGFLVNPNTKERMQLDRFYPPRGEFGGVAFEFNGPQHDGPTKLFSAESAANQRARDLMKIGICITEGITVVVVHPEDLSLEAIKHKVGKLLPLRRLEGHERLIAYLESRTQHYRSSAADEEWLT